jgi:hypothetical protein
MKPSLSRLISFPWVAEAVSLIGALWYSWQLWVFAHTQESVLDEGAYIYKGLLFASGQYIPYQPNGPWTNHMPLAFLIPGYLQAWFGPGIRAARYSAIVLAILMLIGMWLLSRRLGNRWWAAAVVWALALNPALLKTYSTAVSQGLVACMLVWMLTFALGDDRPWLQIVLGSILAGAMVMTRINMLPVAPLLVLYILWQYGVRMGIVSALAAGSVVIFWHALYWPDILQVWTRLPKSLTPFLDAWRLPGSYKQSWKPDVSTVGRVLSFFHSLRFHFVSMMGVMATILLWPRRTDWKKASDMRSAVFLLALFVSLLLSHMWAALGKDYCVFCLAGYVSFFTASGLLLILLTAMSWRKHLSLGAQLLIVLIILAASAGIGYGAFEQISDQLYNINIPRWMLGSPEPGSAPLGAVLINKFAIAAQDLRRLLPLIFGLSFGAAVLLCTLAVTYLAMHWSRRQAARSETAFANPGKPSYIGREKISFGYWALVIFLIAGFALGPTSVLAGGYGTYDCPGDVIASYEAAGQHLARMLTPGALVYWKGTLSTVPLLYVRDIRIFPAQINDGYSMLESGDDLVLITRFGRWNEVLSHQWAEQADYILIEERSFRGWLRELVKGGGFEELAPTPPAAACRPDSQIRIFKRLP